MRAHGLRPISGAYPMQKPLFGPIRTLILAAALWLPLTFVVWFFWKALFAYPVYLGSKAVFAVSLPEVVTKVEQGYFADETITGKEPAGQVLGTYQHRFTIDVPVAPELGQLADPGKRVELVVDINPLIYGYSLPLLAGLILVTPLRKRDKLLQFLVGYLVLLPQQVYGVSVDLLQKLVFLGTPESAALVLSYGISKDVLALAYQFGYLLLPPVLPILTWLAMNRRFVEKLVLTDAEEAFEEPAAEEAPKAREGAER